MNITDRKLETETVDIVVTGKMHEIALCILEAQKAGAYPDGLPAHARRALSIALTFGPDLSALKAPAAS